MEKLCECSCIMLAKFSRMLYLVDGLPHKEIFNGQYVRSTILPLSDKPIYENWNIREHDSRCYLRGFNEGLLLACNVVCPIPHVEEERECKQIVDEIKKLMLEL